MTNFQLSIPVQKVSKEELAGFYVSWGLLGAGIGTGLWYFATAIAPAIPLLSTMPHFWASILYISFVVAAGLLYVYVPFRVAIMHEHGRNIVANQDGLGLPPALGGIVAMPWLSWTDIKVAHLITKKGKPDSIAIKDVNGKKFRLPLTDMPDQDIEQVLLALEAWGTNAAWSSALTNYRDNLQNSIRGIEGSSNTLELHDALARRFSATNFIPLEPGAKLRSGTITIKRQMAFGGFSAVYEAEDAPGQTVVMKELVVAKFDNEAAREKVNALFTREAELLSQLDHPQIVKLKDHFTEDGRKYMVLDHISGRTLRDVVRSNGVLKEDKVIQIALQMVGILAYLHGRNPPLVHRDFTPDNLVLHNDGTIVLIDFGAANEFLAEATGTLIGKQGYMPPEQIRGKAEPASDLYALGGTIYFLLTGQDPEALSSCDLTSQDVSAELRQLVSQLTELSKDQRPRSTGEVANRLIEISPVKHMIADSAQKA